MSKHGTLFTFRSSGKRTYHLETLPASCILGGGKFSLNKVPPAATLTRREMSRNVEKCRKMLSFIEFFRILSNSLLGGGTLDIAPITWLKDPPRSPEHTSPCGSRSALPQKVGWFWKHFLWGGWNDLTAWVETILCGGKLFFSVWWVGDSKFWP